MALAAGQLAQQVGILSAAGARYIMVFNLPDAGKTPFGVASGQGPLISALSSFYNDTLNTGLNALHIDIIRLDVFGLLNEVLADPATYGLTNVSTPACGTTIALLARRRPDALNAAVDVSFARRPPRRPPGTSSSPTTPCR